MHCCVAGFILPRRGKVAESSRDWAEIIARKAQSIRNKEHLYKGKLVVSSKVSHPHPHPHRIALHCTTPPHPTLPFQDVTEETTKLIKRGLNLEVDDEVASTNSESLADVAKVIEDAALRHKESRLADIDSPPSPYHPVISHFTLASH